MKHLKRILLLTLLSCFFAFNPVYADDFTDDATGRDDAKAYQLYGDVYLISSIKFQYGRPKIVTKSVFPQLQTESLQDDVDTFNQVVSDFVHKEVASFLRQVSLNQPLQQQLPRAKVRNDLYIDYDTSMIKSGSDHIMSIRFTMQGFLAGMAHSFHYHRVLNYNLSNDQTIVLSDLFQPGADYLDVMSAYTRNVLSRRLADKEDKEMIEKGTEPSADNFQNWNIKPNGLLITFDESQVASYVAGAQTVLIPYSILKNITSPKSPLASCINHRKRCAQQNFLTGGFIDEATNMRNRALNPVLSKT
jgi:hypothetical protein